MKMVLEEVSIRDANRVKSNPVKVKVRLRFHDHSPLAQSLAACSFNFLGARGVIQPSMQWLNILKPNLLT